MNDREFTRAAKHEAFSRTKGASNLQFSLRAKAIGTRWENRHGFKGLVSYECSYASMASNKCNIAYLVVISHLDKLVQPSYTLCTQIRPLATLEAS